MIKLALIFRALSLMRLIGSPSNMGRGVKSTDPALHKSRPTTDCTGMKVKCPTNWTGYKKETLADGQGFCKD